MPPNICHHGVKDEEKENLHIHILTFSQYTDSLINFHNIPR